MTLQVGTTHDVILHFSDTIACGLIVKPYTYRVDIAPQYIPRLGDTDPRGADKARWKSFIQNDFSGGSGLAIWDELTSPTRFATCSFIDVNKEVDRVLPTNINAAGIPGAAVSAVCPQPTSAEAGGAFASKFFSSAFRGPWILEMSGRPHMFQRMGAYVYTHNVPPATIVDYWPPKPEDGYGDYITGEWVEIEAHVPYILYKAVNFSNVVVLGGESYVMVFGAAGTTSIAERHATYQAHPVYSTETHGVGVYDDKLWKWRNNRITYLQPADDTYTARWAGEMFIGNGNTRIQNTKSFNGRMYMGKKDGLWIYDAGTVYIVEDFSDYSHLSNFAMMEVLQGSLYFNIIDKVYRLTSEGTLERLQIPVVDGYITGGCAVGSELIVTCRGEDSVRETWVFDPETGGSRKWFKTGEGPHEAYGVWAPASLQGHVYIAPLAWTWGGSGITDKGFDNSFVFPVVAVSRAQPDTKYQGPNLEYKDNAHLITSRLSLGYPETEKVLNRIIVEQGITGSLDELEVYYVLDPTMSRTGWSTAEPYDWIAKEDWTLLDTMDRDDGDKYSMAFPDDTTCKNLILKFVWSHYISQNRMSLVGYEIEYALAPSNLRVYDMVTFAVDNIELIDTTQENSGQFIAATLYSCAVSPNMFVINMPWPTQHTVRGIVSITSPGGAPAALAYQNFDGGEIPIHVDEM